MQLPRAILFDLDGTLTEPLLDFARIKADLGIGNRAILEAMAEMSALERRRADEILHGHESKAADESVLNPGCEDLLKWITKKGLATAVITRNSRHCAQKVCQKHGLEFEVLITREFEPFKPHPAPLLEACRRLKVCAEDAWMVGDGQYDIEAGNAARVRTVWVSHGKERKFRSDPWQTVTNLPALQFLLSSPSF